MENSVLTTDEIQAYIHSIPPSPQVLQKVLHHLNDGELHKAASAAEEDPALKLYLQDIVNKPIYGFKNAIKELPQIFGVLGLAQAEQIIYNYMISLLTPKQWQLFKLDQRSFHDLQDALGLSWKKILEHKGIDDKSIYSAITLLPASIIVCEALFNAKEEEVNLLRSVKQIDYNTILKRLSGMNLFDLCLEIAKVWEMPEVIGKIVYAAGASGPTPTDPLIADLSAWMHLLFFYQLSQPTASQAGLNDFLEFNIDYVQDIYEEFSELIMDEEAS